MNFYLKIFFIIIPIVLASCHEKDYDVINEARKLFLKNEKDENPNQNNYKLIRKN